MMRVVPIILVCLFASACATPVPIYNRWAREDGLPTYSSPYLSIASAPVAASAATSKFKALTDREGAAYIAAVAASQGHSADVAKSVADLIKADSAPPNYTDLPRTLVVTIDRDKLRPADRLYQTRVTILADGFSLGNYDPTATQITSIDVESMEAKQDVTASAELDPKFGGTLSAGKVSSGLDNSRQETAKLQENTVTNVQVYPGKVTIYRRGAVNVDLIGNTLVKLSARALPSAVQFKAIAINLSLSKKGVDLKPTKASVDISIVRSFQSKPLTVCARVEYLDRYVDTKSQAFYDESQHSVRLVDDKTGWKRYVFVPAEEAAPTTWQLVDASQEGLAIETPTGVRTIHFSSYDDAEAFIAWMTRVGARTIGKMKLFTHSMEGRPVAVSGKLDEMKPQAETYIPAVLPPCDARSAEAALPVAEYYPANLGG